MQLSGTLYLNVGRVNLHVGNGSEIKVFVQLADATLVSDDQNKQIKQNH